MSAGRRRTAGTRPFIFVIWGATGDLATKKLIPALYMLHRKGELPEGCRIVACARRRFGRGGYGRYLGRIYSGPKAESGLTIEASPRPESAEWRRFLRKLDYYPLDFTKDGFGGLASFLEKLDSRHGCGGRRIFYFSVRPGLFEPVAAKMKASGMTRGDGWKRAIFEKPFGRDLKSASELNRHLSSVFRESQLYRLDHYLGKKLVQNLLVFRFANSIFERVWNRDFVDHVQISLLEASGIGRRGGYYDKAGAVRDIVQNHILQVLCLVAMEDPKSLAARRIQDEKLRVLRAIGKIRADDLAFGQYGAGIVGRKKAAAYLDETHVRDSSTTETYAALKLTIANRRWKGVPFYVRTGKRLWKHIAEVNMVLKHRVHDIFRKAGVLHGPDVITIRIQPDEGLSIRFNAKVPGHGMETRPVTMEFLYDREFGPNTPAAYEALISEVMKGDHTLFARWDEVRESWRHIDAVTSLMEAKAKKHGIPHYAAGSEGPARSKRLIEKSGRKWVLFERDGEGKTRKSGKW